MKEYKVISLGDILSKEYEQQKIEDAFKSSLISVKMT